LAEHEESDTNANLTAGNSEEGEAEVCMSLRAEASVAEEPGAENPHAGICAGGIEQSMSLLRWQWNEHSYNQQKEIKQ